ncbi:MAG: hypothetical protein LCH61_10285 [Proteobacteria bacterium]|nr:hypothetical protein [Pseudomonadota bacterium]
MTRGSGDQDGKRSFRVVLTDKDFDTLESASGAFGVGKSELVRRLVRASVDVGPALSVDGVERIEALTGQVRIVGRNLMQVLKAIHRGEAVGIDESEPVWRGLQEMIAVLDAELTGLVEGNGASLRERSGLMVVAALPDNEAA